MCKDTKRYEPYSGKKKSIETAFECPQMLELAARDFIGAIINIFKELKATTFKEQRKN